MRTIAFVTLHFLLANGKKLPPPPGCVDQQLTALSTEIVHDELDIPPAPQSTPYGLQILLDMCRVQYMNMIDYMKTREFRVSVETQIAEEKVIYENNICVICSNLHL